VKLSKFFFDFNFFCLIFLILTACSLYQSDGRENIEKNSRNIVTGAGVSLDFKIRYECASLMALPVDWQTNVTALDEFSTLEGSKAVLLNGYETPTVVVYHWVERHVEGCNLSVLDSKLSTQNLSDVVGFGETLLTQSSRR
jgi:hypothetical protein